MGVAYPPSTTRLLIDVRFPAVRLRRFTVRLRRVEFPIEHRPTDVTASVNRHVAHIQLAAYEAVLQEAVPESLQLRPGTATLHRIDVRNAGGVRQQTTQALFVRIVNRLRVPVDDGADRHSGGRIALGAFRLAADTKRGN